MTEVSGNGEAPRSWGPLLGAFAVALVVIIGAILWFFLGSDVSTVEQDAIAVCEEMAVEAGLPEIARGDVSGPDEDGVISIAWEFDDGTFGGCDAQQLDDGGFDAELVGDAVQDL
ncbi:hypothetical protein [Demequina flava]|uniref:hypothetical protein n=1 Tax=Demequina flava TaxID=1095025 RepID=UPI000783BD65|nr:hypothetical protein [Demequina flava]